MSSYGTISLLVEGSFVSSSRRDYGREGAGQICNWQGCSALQPSMSYRVRLKIAFRLRADKLRATLLFPRKRKSTRKRSRWTTRPYWFGFPVLLRPSSQDLSRRGVDHQLKSWGLEYEGSS